MVTPTEVQSIIDNNTVQPAPLAWKEFRRRTGIRGPRIYTYAAPCTFQPSNPPHVPTSDSNSAQYVSLVIQALQELGASTGGSIASWIARTFDIPTDKINSRRLHYIINAILSSPKYRDLFHKEQVLRDEKRTLWSLSRRLDEDEGDNLRAADTTPIPSPTLSLKPQASPSVTSSQASPKIPNIIRPVASPSMVKLEPSSPTLSLSQSQSSLCPSQSSLLPPQVTSPTVYTPSSEVTSPPPTSPCVDGGAATPQSLSSRRRKRKDSEEMEAKKIKVSSVVE